VSHLPSAAFDLNRTCLVKSHRALRKSLRGAVWWIFKKSAVTFVQYTIQLIRLRQIFDLDGFELLISFSSHACAAADALPR
jgi:hypothetical protein